MTTTYLISAAVLAAIIIIIWYWLRLKRSSAALPVLMYHKVISSGNPDFLSIKRNDLEEQFKYLKEKGYNTILLSDLHQYMARGVPLPEKPCLITFDDGYRNNYTEMFPLLVKYSLRANIFLVASFLETDGKSEEEYMRPEELKLMANGSVEYGLHSLKHDSYKDMSLEAIKADVLACREIFTRLEIPVQPALAYTYGAFPKTDRLKRQAMFSLFESLGIKMAFRIGNRKNPLPISEQFVIQRLDIRGDEGFGKFVKALRFGKKPF